MKLRGSALKRWLAWTLFWCLVYYAGVEVQTWVFNKEFGKPPAADVFGPVHFWGPAVFFFAPVWSLQHLFQQPGPGPLVLSVVRLAVLLWSIIVAGLVVWVEGRLRPGLKRSASTVVLIGVTTTLLFLRLAGLLPFAREGGDEAIMAVSYLLLSGLVLLTYASLAIGIPVIAFLDLRRRMRPIPQGR